jgi:hypothetical protein
MSVDRNIGAAETIESISMIEIQMVHDDCLDVFVIVLSLLNSCI